MSEFRRIENIADYVAEALRNGTAEISEVAKFARITAVQGVEGQEVVTTMANGLEETRNTVTLDPTTGEPGWIVTNPGGEQYIVADSTFKKKYEIDPQNPEVYKPKGGPVLTMKLDEAVAFDAPWGGEMRIEAGGSLVLSGPNDIYGIQPQEFADTYRETETSRLAATQAARDMLGVETPNFFKLAAEKAQPEVETIGDSFFSADGPDSLDNVDVKDDNSDKGEIVQDDIDDPGNR